MVRIPSWVNHYRVTAIGHLGAIDADQFSYGFNMKGQQPGANWNNETGRAEWLRVADLLRDFHIAAATQISNKAVLTKVKVAQISAGVGGLGGPGGKYIGTSEEYAYNAPGGAAGGLDFILPQSALAVSLVTGLNTPRGRGRFYIPMPVVTVQPNDEFRIALANAESTRGTLAALITAVNDWPGVDALNSPEVHVVSSWGISTRVSGVRVGRIVDTIRSRRNKLAENYTGTLAVS